LKKTSFFTLIVLAILSLLSFHFKSEQNISLNVSLLDFGYKENIKTVKINFNSINESYWKVYSLNSNKWVFCDLVEGNVSKSIDVTIIRSKLEYGKNIDTLYFELVNENQNVDNKEIIALPVVAFKRPSIIEALTYNIQNSILILKQYFDSTYTFFGSYKVNHLNKETNIGISYFADKNSIFADAGNNVYFKSGNSTDNMNGLLLNKRSIDYYKDSSNFINADFYLDLISNQNILFDNKSYHLFRANGGGQINAIYSDSILSVAPIECFPEPSQITMSTIPLSLFWKKTASPDDSVYAVLVSKNDESFKVTSIKPVNDDKGALVVPPSLLAKVLTGNRVTYIWIIRYRSKLDVLNRRILVSQSQKSYEIILN
jgi:hypothetical protein